MSVDSTKAGEIHRSERDYFLDIHSDEWGSAVSDQDWQRVALGNKTRFLKRLIQSDATTPSRNSQTQKSLTEYIVRFPSAPIFGIHRKHEYQNQLQRINHHTMRIIKREATDAAPPQISRVFLVHNGLDEIDDMSFYYKLADEMLDDESAIIIRPFPGHLTRCPFPSAYAESPLAGYLQDSGNLFRQFLCYMLETQWLLSALVPVPSYPALAGAELLAEKKDRGPRLCRTDTPTLAHAIFNSWTSVYQTNPAERASGLKVTEANITDSVQVLRELLGWRAATVAGARKRPDAVQPRLHTIGYSLGGYVAQCVFFTWPFAMSSCTSMLSGGALRNLALNSFAQPEEWQFVMRALRFEVESAMATGRFGVDQKSRTVAGIEYDLFAGFHRTFYEVFLQDWENAYQSRISEYAPRLLHVLGGADEIVTRESLLRATPQEGINSLQIANLTHFPMQRFGEWSDFWLPEVARLIRNFSVRTEVLVARSLTESFERQEAVAAQKPQKQPREEPRSVSRRNEGRLNSHAYVNQLTKMVDILEHGGWLMMLRNRVPSALLADSVVELNQVIHHEDREIARYLDGLRERGRSLHRFRKRLTVILPDQLDDWFMRESAIFPAKVGVSGGHIPDEQDLRKAWKEFNEQWSHPVGVLRRFDPMRPPNHQKKFPFLLDATITTEDPFGKGKPRALINTLPNVWIAIAKTMAKEMAGTNKDQREEFELSFVAWCSRLAEGKVETKRDFEKWMASETLQIVRVSSAELNPDLMGQRILDLRVAKQLLCHSAAAYCYSHEWSDDS
jgi:pimeloyl-ACP methyl ester carboxylesterase